ncbi:F-box/LRR-repeat protein At5g63520-like [Neltuma alba]|uniref:F-box/LRR-repeat protein At5g63520-like n=1 Tax=Neltuma alba TaxID=207710 RepID=UPI0010A2BFC6|nr:F-box/LRR-repeat protein At5g63520-like [Prosopis alba]
MESREAAPIYGCKDDILPTFWADYQPQPSQMPLVSAKLGIESALISSHVPCLLGSFIESFSSWGVEEVTEKVLSKPILSQRLGSRTPLVTHIGNGVMGTEALTNQLRESIFSEKLQVKWDYFDYQGPHPREANGFSDVSRGMVLVVGYVPGLKVDAIPLIHPKNDSGISMGDDFVRHIKAFAYSVSGNHPPTAIIIFGDRKSDMNDIVATMDQAIGKETVMVGDGGGCFLFNSRNYTINLPPDLYVLDAVALVFAKDSHKSPDVGETRFHVAMAGGLVPFGPRFEVIDVLVKGDIKWTCFSALMEGFNTILTFEAVIETLLETVSDRRPDLYIGVSHGRRCYSGNGRLIKKVSESTSFHQVLGGEGEYFVVEGVGVRAGDTFLFYHRDLETARTTSEIAFENLTRLKQSFMGSEETVFGGLIFACASRGQSYFGTPNTDIYPFHANFPSVPVAGIFCKGEIGRCSSSSSSFVKPHESQEQAPPHCPVHASSAVYLALSYLPPP